MTENELKIRKLLAIVGAERSVATACVGLLRLKLPQQPAQRQTEILELERLLAIALRHNVTAPEPGLAEAEQHLVADLHREALDDAFAHLLAELRK